MQVAVDVAGFSAGDADELRRAMGSKRSTEKMERLRGRFFAGMAANGITGELAAEDLRRRCWRSPTSASRRATRSASRRWSTTAPGSSSTTRRRSARRCSTPSRWASTHRSRWWPTPGGTGWSRVGPDVNLGRAEAVLQPRPAAATGGRPSGWGWPRCAGSGWTSPRRSTPNASAAARTATSPISPGGCGSPSRAGRGAGHGGGVRLLRDRPAGGAVGGRGGGGGARRSTCRARAVGLEAPALPGLTDAELTVADVWATGVSPDSHPIQHLRDQLDGLGAIRIDRLGAPRAAQRPGGAAAAGAGRRAGHPPAAPGHRGAGSRS